jgi:hypothetical protein
VVVGWIVWCGDGRVEECCVWGQAVVDNGKACKWCKRELSAGGC